MSDYEKGDRLRVTLTATVDYVCDDSSGELHCVTDGISGQYFFLRPNSEFVTVVKLPGPEPEWRLGHVVRDRDGLVWAANDNGSPWVDIVRGVFRRDYEMHRPFTVLAVPVESDTAEDSQ